MKASNRIISFLAILLIVWALAECTNSEPYVFLTEYSLEYQVSGTASRANIAYEVSGSSYVEQTNIVLPWAHQITYYDFQVGTPVFLSAQSLDQLGTVTVTISAKGSVYKQATSGNGGFVAIYGNLP